jgi:hypothetical protein
MPYGMGRGGWFGWPHWAYWAGWYPGFHPPYWPPLYPFSQEDEEAVLTGQAEVLEAELRQIQERLDELKKFKTAKEEKRNGKQT